ncbi:MAG: hypothetical protein R3182_02655 [Draconibacterium sp.]|nr:hypothetical protein [Draconibacterium sp.]
MKTLTTIINELKSLTVTKAGRKLAGYSLLSTLFALLLMFTTSANSSENPFENDVLKAYELRVDGKVDEAKTLLENILKEDPANAMAHYELARTLNYIDLRGSKEADLHLKKAIEYDSKNVIYAFYNARNSFLKAYIALQTGGDNAKELINNVCDEYLKVLEMKPDYPEALMYLVEIYGMLPEEIGGDKTKAEKYTQQLEKLDKFYGAKARLVMMPEGTDMAKYWNAYITNNGEDCKALKELGVACIFADDIEGAQNSFEKAIKLDNAHNIRILDLGRYHMMKVMQNRDLADEELPKSKKFVDQYLATTPEPIPPLKAYALGMLAKINMFSGNREEGQKMMEKAKAIDPYFSRAFGIPSLSIFESPTELNNHFSSFFSPF